MRTEVLSPFGEFDLASRDELETMLEAHATTKELIIDLSDVDYIDSTALSTFASFVQRRQALLTLFVVPVSRRIRRIWNLVGFDAALNTVESLQIAHDQILRR